ncbi:Uncharacterised protein [Staphylococcus aureus]|nr:Uncharacterised protein [Staphylococcus aureus]
MSFNNEFSTNQIFFNPSFVMETIAIINEYQKRYILFKKYN